jgi:hypothetical protein
MDNKGQTGLTVFFVLVIFGLIYFIGLAGMVGAVSSDYAIANNATGLDGWFFANINFIFTLGYVLSLMAVGYFGMR